MTYRKIIGFGDSSFVVSLPKEWIRKNGLKKGEVLDVEEEGNNLKITPNFLKQTNKSKEIKITFEGELRKLKSEVLYAYINNFNVVTIVGKDLYNYLDDIKEITKDFMYLDIVDQTSQNKIVLNTSINLFDISIYDTIRRMDRIVLSMAEDVKNYLTGKNSKVKDLLVNKEENINKLCNLIFKTLKGGFNPNDRAILGLEINDIFYYWELALFIEKVADLLKRIPRFAKPNVPEELIILFDKALEQYNDATKSNFTKDYKLAINVITRKKDVYDYADEIISDMAVEYIVLSEKIGGINNCASSIAKALLRLNLNLDTKN